jgi:ATP-dependent helicase HrpA
VAPPLPRDAAAFRALLDAGRGALAARYDATVELAREILTEAHEVRAALAAADSPAFRDAVDEARSWLDALLPEQFLVATPDAWLDELPRYLKAATRRLAGLQGNVERDRARIVELAEWAERLDQGRAAGVTGTEVWNACRWLLEEYRVSLFDQSLGTRVAVSPKRLRRAFAALDERIALGAG